MIRETHRVLATERLGLFGVRELTPDDRHDADGYPLPGDADETALAEAAAREGITAEEAREGFEAIDVAFIPKEGFEATGLEPLTDDPAIAPPGMWAAFHPIR